MSESETTNRRAELVQRIWEILHRSWLLKILGSALLLLYLFAILLQQMPGQLHDDPAGAQRWELITSETYGPLGNVLSALGLFNVIHNPLLQLLLVLLLLIVLIHLGNHIAQAWRLWQIARRQIAARSEEDATVAGDPLLLPTIQPTYRLRQAVTTEVTTLVQMAQAKLQQGFDKVDQHTVPVHPIQLIASGKAISEGAEEEVQDETSGTTMATECVEEKQLWALRKITYALLRPLFFLGLLLALITIWIILIWGWDVNPSPLVPGADYRSATYQLVLQYEVVPVTMTPVTTTTIKTSPAGTSPIDVTTTVSTVTTDHTESSQMVSHAGIPMLVAEIGKEQRRAPLGTTMWLNYGQTVITSKAGPPALFLRTTAAEPLLSRLGQSQMVPTMGLIFPSPGSEESVVIDQALGLRIVRLPTQTAVPTQAFEVEVYDANNDLINRIQLQESSTISLTIENRPVTLEFVFLAGMQVAVAHQPAIWLFWPAALLILIGLIGYSGKPAFVLLQFAPWPIDRTVVVAQSDDEHEISLIQQWLHHDLVDANHPDATAGSATAGSDRQEQKLTTR